MSKKKFALISAVVLCSLCTVALLVFRLFFVWMVRVPTGAMANTIIPGDHLMVFRSSDIKRGDIVVFRYPDAQESYVARVIGLPGERIQLWGKAVLINDRELDELRVSVAPAENFYDPLIEISTEGTGPYRVYYTQHRFPQEEPQDPEEFGTATPFQIPAGSYFLLGDNRDNSYDSRYRGAVPKNLIWGKPSIIYYSARLTDESDVRTERIFKRVQ